ncbi:MAG: nitroreductase family protein [Anaerolineales bacterium]|nr:nitroreductase family protein [Anaerolineales bacterium]
MEFADLIKERRSIRMFTPQPVEAEKLEAILNAANIAPSAGNLQAYEIYVVTQPEQRAALALAALNQNFIAQAPVALVFCSHPVRNMPKYGRRGEGLYALQDATIACTYAMLAAADQGLGSVWVGAFNDEAVTWVIQPGADLRSAGPRPVVILSIGYAGESPPPRLRRPLTDLVHRL